MRKKMTFLVLSIWFLLALTIPNAMADTYLGQTTWTVEISESSSNPPGVTLTLTGGITRVGGTYYLFQGYVLPPDGDLPFVLSGSGVLIGKNLLLTLTTSQEHTSSWRDTGVLRATIDKTSLNGSFYEVRTDLDLSDKTFHREYSLGTLTRTGQAISLTPANAAMLILLLE